MSKTREQYGERTAIETEKLTDGSFAYNVVYYVHKTGHHVRFGCTSEKAAYDLADELDNAAWVEVDPS